MCKLDRYVESDGTVMMKGEQVAVFPLEVQHLH